MANNHTQLFVIGFCRMFMEGGSFLFFTITMNLNEKDGSYENFRKRFL